MTRPDLARPLAHKDFRLLLAAFATSRAGDFLYTIALVVYVLQVTGSSAWVSATVVVRVVPLVVGASFAGLLADRVDRRRLMVLCDLARFVLMLAIAAVAALSGPILLVVLLIGLTTLAGMPYSPAFYASMPRLVPERDLAAANSLVSTVECLSLVVGPGIGGLLVSVASPSWAFVLNAATFLVSAAFVLRATVPAAERTEDDEEDVGTLTGIRLGVQTMTSDRLLATLSVCILAITFIYGFELVYLVLVARDLLGMGASGVGYLDAAVGVGGLVGAVVAPRLARSRRPLRVIALVVVLNAAPLAVLAALRSPWAALLVLGVEGVASLVLDVMANTIMQRVVPGTRLARVEGLLASLSTATLLLGSLIAPLLLHLVGLQTALVLAATVPAAVTLLMLLRVRGAEAEVTDRLREIGPRLDLLGELDLFAGADPVALERVARALQPLELPAGSRLISEGDPADDLFVITCGTVAAWTGRRPAEPRLIAAPSYVGEIGLLQHRPRTATVEADTDIAAFRLDGAEFLAAVSGAGGPSRALEGRIAERLTASFG